MEAVIFKAQPHNQFRLGQTTLENTWEVIHSDTLFSAIVHAHAMLYGQAETTTWLEWLLPGKGKAPPISFSSAFHCLEYLQGKYLYFFPKPVTYGLASDSRNKQHKQIQFVSRGIWREGIQPEALIDYPILGNRHALTWEELKQLRLLEPSLLEDLLEQRENVRLNPQERYAFHQQKQALLAPYALTQAITYPKVSVHQVGQEDAYYTQTNLQLQALSNQEGKSMQTHFYFLLDTSNDEKSTPYTRQFYAALQLLVDEGIGGDRSTGTGMFSGISIEKFPVPRVPTQTHRCTLSLSRPTAEEFPQYLYYQLVMRGGGSLAGANDLSDQHHRKQVRMIGEGAMIPLTGNLWGTHVEIAPENHPTKIIRYGYTFSIPVHYA